MNNAKQAEGGASRRLILSALALSVLGLTVLAPPALPIQSGELSDPRWGCAGALGAGARRAAVLLLLAEQLLGGPLQHCHFFCEGKQ